MHDTAMRIGSLALELYANRNSKILEIGSYDINGALRSSAPEGAEYVGLDIEAGPGVDIVIVPGEPFPVADNYFDLILASSVFEHDRWFWQTFTEMCRKLKAGGYIYISAPSNGTIHRHPADNWRFYPDAGHALAEWASAQGQKVELVESFVAEREAVVWNDFVAVFRKEGGRKHKSQRMLHELVRCTNVLIGESREFLNPRYDPEDQLLLGRSYAEIADLRDQLKTTQDDAERLNQFIASEKVRVVGIESSLREHQITLAEQRSELREKQLRIEDHLSRFAEHEALFKANEERTFVQEVRIEEQAKVLAANQAQLEAELSRLASLEFELSEARHRLATLESELIQRQEEIDQTLDRLRISEVQQEALRAECGAIQDKYQDANAWVFRLSGERQKAQASEKRMAAKVHSLERELRSAVAQIEILSELLDIEKDNSKRIPVGKTPAPEISSAPIVASDELHPVEAPDPGAAVEGEGGEQIDRLTSLLQERDKLLGEAEHARASAERRLNERFAEIAALTNMLREKSGSVDVVHAQSQWLKRLNEVTMSYPRWWVFLPKSWRQKREHDRLERRGLFCARRYLELYPDVASERIDPVRHFVLHGMDEGRINPI